MTTVLDSPVLLLAGYCVVVFGASLAGGWLPMLLRLTHTRLQLAVSFVGGLMLGLALLGMLPHALQHTHGIHGPLAWLLAGFLMMFLLQRFLPFHHHDVAEGSPLEPCGHTHSLAERSARNLSWVGVALGLSLHSIFDGLAIAAAVMAGTQAHNSALGLGTALAVILHKPFCALAISTLMVAGLTARSTQRWVTLGFALVTPVGALLFFLGGEHLAHAQPAWLGAALAFCAGTFLCIACADLLPELQFHTHDRIKLSLALLAGLGVAILIALFGHAGENSHQHAKRDGRRNHSGWPITVPPAEMHPLPAGEGWSEGERIACNQGASRAFTLTLTLSLREREQQAPQRESSSALRSCAARRKLFPLSAGKGEGRRMSPQFFIVLGRNRVVVGQDRSPSGPLPLAQASDGRRMVAGES